MSDKRRESSQIEIYEYFLKPGYLLANREDTVVRAVLGNCVAVSMFDRESRFGGMNHFLFPESRHRRDATAQYGNIAVHALYRLLINMGAQTSSLEAQIFGGSINRNLDDGDLGKRNAEAARKMLRKIGVRVASEDVGGTRGRKVIYHTGSNETIVYKVDNIRDSDWFLPGQDIRFSKTASR
jgi:chemotaxis protein CheD